MTADPYARLDAAYLLGALDADERLAYEAHQASRILIVQLDGTGVLGADTDIRHEALPFQLDVQDPLKVARRAGALHRSHPLAATPAGANSMSLILVVLPFISSAFVPTGSMPAGVRWFAEYQPSRR